MSRRVRIGIIISVVGIALVALGFFTLNTIVRQVLTPLPAPTPMPAITEKVVVITHDVALGTLLDANDLTLVDMPVEFVLRDSLLEIESAVGRFTKVDLIAGQMVLQHNLADPTNVNHDIAYILGDDQVLMAFQPSDLMTGLGIIERGDLVDIFVTMEMELPKSVEGEDALVAGEDEEEETESFFLTFDAMQRVVITAMVADVVYAEEESSTPAIPGIAGEPEPTPVPKPISIKIRAFLLALNAQDALVLKHLVDLGVTFDLVIRAPTNDRLFELQPVMSKYLQDLYNFEIPEPEE